MEYTNKDKLNLTNHPSIIKQFDKNTRVIWSGELEKINKWNRRQKRKFGLTRDTFFNIGDEGWADWFISYVKWSIFKRVVSITEIEFCTYSLITNHWVIHVPNEYDYELSSPYRDEFLYELLKAREKLTNHKMGFYIMNHEGNLSKYKKNDTELNSKLPDQPSIAFTSEEFKIFSEKQKSEITQESNESILVLSKSNTEKMISISDFEILNV